MLKHFAAATLGFAVMFGATGPAAAGKSGYVWVNKPFYVYTSPSTAYTSQPKAYTTRTVKSKGKAKFDPKLDFETEAVWRNLRPEWFDD
jgi:hypothetical protein